MEMGRHNFRSQLAYLRVLPTKTEALHHPYRRTSPQLEPLV